MQFIEIKYQDPATKAYLGSPSIVRLDSGDLLATHDYFGPGCPKNHEAEEHLTSVYRSSDDGRSWTNSTHISGAFWSTLFRHRGSLYLIGTSQQYGSIVIRRSGDSGYTWTHPSDAKSGLLFTGGPYRAPPNYHTAPVPVAEIGGRLYRAFEDCDPCIWGTGFQSLVISADASTDLLDASNWTVSNRLAHDPASIPAQWGSLERPGWLEGNVVETPKGEVWNILRFNSSPLVDKAAVIQVQDEGRQIIFNPDTGFIDFPGGMSKFTIRRDSATGQYLTLSNGNTDPAYPRQRNTLSVYSSTDLVRWIHVKDVLEDDSGLSHEESVRSTGFQYVDWQFDGEDIVFVSRTAYHGAHNYHDANRITFHKIERYRTLL